MGRAGGFQVPAPVSGRTRLSNRPSFNICAIDAGSPPVPRCGQPRGAAARPDLPRSGLVTQLWSISVGPIATIRSS